jgi:hypothetical protein
MVASMNYTSASSSSIAPQFSWTKDAAKINHGTMIAVEFVGKAHVLAVCGLFLVSAGTCQEPPPKAKQRSPAISGPALPSTLTAKTNPITDLVLIYDGADDRIPWTVDRFRPYVYREEAGKMDWLYDGFLFLDRLAKSGRRLSPITNRKDAVKSDWLDLLDHYFRPGESIAALELLLDSLAARGDRPLRKRMVVIALPTPMTGSDPNRIVITSEWGELDARKLDFNQAQDRVEAAQWYVDEALKRWQQMNYKHLELAGFYWLFERAWRVHQTAAIGQYINSKGSRLYWIPSWPQGRKNWQEYGFDFVYQQPNYFFHRQPTPADRLEAACQFAEGCGTTMEMEFNKDLLTKAPFLTYFDEYLQAYETHHVWDKKPVAYYEGGGTWRDMAESKDPAVQRRFQAMADIIVKRQRKADNGFVFRQEAK